MPPNPLETVDGATGYMMRQYLDRSPWAMSQLEAAITGDMLEALGTQNKRAVIEAAVRLKMESLETSQRQEFCWQEDQKGLVRSLVGAISELAAKGPLATVRAQG
jgi:hypothetical protein